MNSYDERKRTYATGGAASQQSPDGQLWPILLRESTFRELESCIFMSTR